MLDTTKKTIEGVFEMLSLDPSITDAQKRAAMDALEGKTAAAFSNPEPIDRAISREAAAQLLNCTTRTITEYARRGIIRPLRFGANGKRARGYSEASVREALKRTTARG